MIPKKIHYCWFGNKPKPKLVKKCIKSWKKYLPDYEIIEWNENNFDVNSNIYCKEAYEEKKWAFITDYVRLKVLYEFGGIYMDTDVEILKKIDDLLDLEGFSGFENIDRVPTGIIASEKGQALIFELIQQYDNRHFRLENQKLDMTTNVEVITQKMVEKGLKLNNTKQTISGLTFYPLDYFCPKDYQTKVITLTNNTYCIHHFDGSWQSPYHKLKYKFLRFLGPSITNLLVKLKHKLKK